MLQDTDRYLAWVANIAIRDSVCVNLAITCLVVYAAWLGARYWPAGLQHYARLGVILIGVGIYVAFAWVGLAALVAAAAGGG